MKSSLKATAWALLIVLSASLSAFAQTAHLTFMTFGPDSMIQTFERVIDQFEAENPGVTIELVRATGSADLRDKALIAFAANLGPDLIGGDDAAAYPLMASGNLVEISEFIAGDPDIAQIQESLLPGIWQMATYGGARYTIPISIALADWYINVDHFNEAGIALPGDDWTWDDFLNAAKSLTLRNGDVITRAGYSVEVNALHEILPWIRQAGGEPFDDWYRPTKAQFSSEPVTEALRFFHALRWDHGVFPPHGEPIGSIDRFMQGRSSMLTHWPARVGQFAQAGLEFEWRVQRAPHYRSRSTIGAIDGVKIGSQSKHPEIAWAFLKFLVRPDVQRILAPNVQIPVVQEVTLAPEWLEHPVAGINKIAFLKDAEFVQNRAQDPSVANDIDRVFLEEWRAAFNDGAYPVEQMVENIDARLDAILSRR